MNNHQHTFTIEKHITWRVLLGVIIPLLLISGFIFTIFTMIEYHFSESVIIITLIVGAFAVLPVTFLVLIPIQPHTVIKKPVTTRLDNNLLTLTIDQVIHRINLNEISSVTMTKTPPEFSDMLSISLLIKYGDKQKISFTSSKKSGQNNLLSFLAFQKTLVNQLEKVRKATVKPNIYGSKPIIILAWGTSLFILGLFIAGVILRPERQNLSIILAVIVGTVVPIVGRQSLAIRESHRKCKITYQDR